MSKRGIALRAPALRVLIALLVLLALSGGSMLPPLNGPSLLAPAIVGAASATVSTCDESGLNAALHAVQTAGGGTIYFTCTGTIAFSGQKTITSNVKIVNTNVTIFGAEVAFQGDGLNRLFVVNAGARLALGGLKLFDGGPATGQGGLIYNAGTLELVGSTLDDSGADLGGAIYNDGGAVSINGSAFNGNHAVRGGAIFNAGGAITITASMFHRNTVSAVEVLSVGGAIYNASGTLTIAASTFLENAADVGGAIANDSGGTLQIIGSTLSNNAGFHDGGGLSNSPGTTATIRASIMDNHVELSGNCFNGGTLNSGGYNHSSDATCNFGSTGDRENSGTVFGPLAANGGPTPTILPAPDSDTVDAIPENECLDYTTSADQRGVSRPLDRCDIGAIELGQVPVQVLAVYALAEDMHPEGSPVEVVVLAFGPSGAALNYAFDCDDDGSYEIGPQAAASALCLIQSNGAANVYVQVCHNANCGTGVVTLDIANVAPTIIDVASDAPVEEGSPATITVTATDPAGVNDPLTVSADCDDSGDFETAGSATTVQCTFDEQGSYTVPVRVDDGDGGSATSSIDISVNNADPVITDVTNDGPVDERGAVTIEIAATDPAGANDPLRYEFDCGNDGTYELGPQVANTALCSFADSGIFTVPVRVTDDDGGVATDSTTVTVNNLDPTITEVLDDGPIAEGSQATITVTATDPAGVNDPLQYEFDCDDDGTYEIGPQASNSAQCAYGDNGLMTVPVRVTDDDGGEATGSTIVTVDNVAPTVGAPSVDIEPSNEGQSVVASASFSDPGTLDTHTCTVDYDDGSGPQAGSVDQQSNTCTGPPHTYVDDDPSGTASDQYSVEIIVTDDDGDSGDNSVAHTVNNVAPTIDSITTDAPVPQGQPVTVMVNASDVGVNDTLTYSFDCDNNGSYETPGGGNEGACNLAPAASISTIGVMVEDDDLGTVTDSVTVGQTITLCLSTATGAVVGTWQDGSCNGGTVVVTLPAAYPVTLCISNYSGGLRQPASGACSSGERQHIVPASGPLYFCEHLWTNQLRAPWLPGQCNAFELPGVIPG